VLVIVSGLPATGKTTLCQALAERIRGAHLRIDTIEQAIVRSGAATHPLGTVGYVVGYAAAEDLLRQRFTVIADSVNPLPATRRAWRATATSAGTAFVDVEVVCSDRDEHERRAASRVSDIAGLQLPSWPSIVERDYHRWEHDHIVIDTAHREVNDCVEELITLVAR
jgi:predicted kinase